MQRFHVRNAFPSSKSLLELTHVYNDDVDNDVVNNDDADNDDNDNMSLPTAVGYLLYEQQKTSGKGFVLLHMYNYLKQLLSIFIYIHRLQIGTYSSCNECTLQETRMNLTLIL